MFIYLITNSATGKIYVGQHKGNNLKKYLQMKFSQSRYELKRKGHGRGSHLFNAMRKYPNQSDWSITPLISGVQTREALNAWEITLIELFDTRNPEIGYNICKGGEGFTGHHSIETKEKLRVINMQVWQSPEMREQHSIRLKEVFNSNPDIVEKRNQNIKLAHQDPKKKANWSNGIKKAHREKGDNYSRGMKNVWNRQEYRERMGVIRKELWQNLNAEEKEKFQASSKTPEALATIGASIKTLWQVPEYRDNLLRRRKEQGEVRRMGLDKFVQLATKVHGSYDYSSVVYANAKTKVIILCPKHGEFSQSPDKHLRGQGCPLCGRDKAGRKKTINTHS
jgi:hypothetical protein